MALGNALLASGDRDSAAEHYQLAQVTDGAVREGVLYDFAAHLAEADVQSPSPDYVRNDYFTIHGDQRRVLFAHPDSHVRYRLTLPASPLISGEPALPPRVLVAVSLSKGTEGGPALAFAVATAPESWEQPGDGVQFDIYIDDGHTESHPFSEYIDPKNIPAHRQWHDREIDLSPWAGQTVTVTFATGPGPNGNSDYDWAGWGEPRIVQPIAYNFLAELPNADRCGADEEHLRQDTLTIDYEPRAILFQHPSSRVTYRVDVPERAGLHFGLGMDPAVWSPDKGDGVEYNVYVRHPDEPYKLYRVFHRYLDPKRNSDDRHWLDQVVDLSAYGGQTVDVIFEALPGPAGDANFDWGGWSMPVLVADDMAPLNAEAWVAVRSGE